jgi:hypothetical protein
MVEMELAIVAFASLMLSLPAVCSGMRLSKLCRTQSARFGSVMAATNGRLSHNLTVVLLAPTWTFSHIVLPAPIWTFLHNSILKLPAPVAQQLLHHTELTIWQLTPHHHTSYHQRP